MISRITNPRVIEFFAPHIHQNWQDQFYFSYNLSGSDIQREYYGPNGHFVPTTNGLWSVTYANPQNVRHIFITYSAYEALCFCQQNPSWIKNEDNISFVALGNYPTAEQLAEILIMFPNGRIHTVFDNNILGKVADCKIALWHRKRDATFRISVDDTIVTYEDRKYKIPIPLFSLSRFEKVSGFRTTVRTHKPLAQFQNYKVLLHSL